MAKWYSTLVLFKRYTIHGYWTSFEILLLKIVNFRNYVISTTIRMIISYSSFVRRFSYVTDEKTRKKLWETYLMKIKTKLRHRSQKRELILVLFALVLLLHIFIQFSFFSLFLRFKNKNECTKFNNFLLELYEKLYGKILLKLWYERSPTLFDNSEYCNKHSQRITQNEVEESS